jgi:phosphoribosylpyrophosphate synthetase
VTYSPCGQSYSGTERSSEINVVQVIFSFRFAKQLPSCCRRRRHLSCCCYSGGHACFCSGNYLDANHNKTSITLQPSQTSPPPPPLPNISSQDLNRPISGRHVLVVEDILDTGHTLHKIYDLLSTRSPASLQAICSTIFFIDFQTPNSKP